MPDTPRELIPTRRSLIDRLKRWDDGQSWQQFFDTYWKLIYGVAFRAGLPDAEAQDVVQDTIVSVARQMPSFRYDPARGSFKTWLFLLARRRIADHLRKEYRRVKIEPDSATHPSRTGRLARMPDPAGPELETLWDEEWKKHLLGAALRRVKAQVEPKHFQVFEAYVLKEWPVEEVVLAFSVSAAQVYTIKHRVGARLEAELRQTELTQ